MPTSTTAEFKVTVNHAAFDPGVDHVNRKLRAMDTAASGVGSRLAGLGGPKAARGLLELGRLAEDAAVGFSLQGLSGAVRGAGNNFTALLTQMSPIAGGLGGIALAAVTLVPMMTNLSQATESASESIQRQTQVIQSWQDVIGNRVSIQGRVDDILNIGDLTKSRENLEQEAARIAAEYNYINEQRKGVNATIVVNERNNSATRESLNALREQRAAFDKELERLRFANQKVQDELNAVNSPNVTRRVRDELETRLANLDNGPIKTAINKAVEEYEKLANEVREAFAGDQSRIATELNTLQERFADQRQQLTQNGLQQLRDLERQASDILSRSTGGSSVPGAVQRGSSQSIAASVERAFSKDRQAADRALNSQNERLEGIRSSIEALRNDLKNSGVALVSPGD